MKKAIWSALLGAAGATVLAVRRPPAVRNIMALTRRRDPTRRYMLFFMLPLWTAAGISDYLYHRKTHIETTSGVEESWMHLLMMMEAGPPILLALFMEINAGVLAAMIAATVAHQATAMWDVAYTVDKRKIPEGEQHTHAFLELLPYSATAFAICTHWEQFLALFGAGDEKARYKFRPRRPPMPLKYAVPLVAGAGMASMLPHIEELWRCYRARQRGLTGSEIPECVRELYSDEAIQPT